MNTESTNTNAAVTSEGESGLPQIEKPEDSSPDHRAHVIRDRNPMVLPVTLYEKNSQVYLRMPRGLQGPFTVSKVNADGTYQLETESGKLFKDAARERDLQPLG